MVQLFIAEKSSNLRRIIHKEHDQWVALVDVRDTEIQMPDGCYLITLTDMENEMLKMRGRGKTIDRDIMEWLKQFPNRPAMDGKTLKQLLEFRGTSLWWFGESIGRYTTILEAIMCIETMKHCLEKYKPSYVTISNGNYRVGKCAAVVCDSLKIPRNEIIGFPGRASELRAIAAAHFKKFRAILRLVICKIYQKNIKSVDKAGTPIMLMSYYHSLKLDSGNITRSRLKDTILFPIAESIERKFGFPARALYIDTSYPFGLSSIRRLRTPAFPIDLYYQPFNRNVSDSTCKVKQLWKRLRNSPEFHESLAYGDINIWPLLKDHFAFLFLKQYPEAIECVNTFERLLLAEKPEVIILSDEVGFYGRAFVTACKNFNIRTIGVQHGAIDENHIEYLHTDEGPLLPCPIPDVTAVWGAKDKRLLIESGLYSESNVIVTGSPRYDCLAIAEKIYNKEKIYTHFKIGNKKLVTITTQPFHIVSERERWLRAVTIASKQLDWVFFVVKPHPAENHSMHERTIKEYGGANIVVCTDIGTNELIYASDLMITSHSTTGLESLILGTPVLTVNLTGMPDVIPYASSGVAVGVYNEDDIVPLIKNVLNGKLPSAMGKNIEKYIHEFTYRVDGNASDRVVSIIEAFLNSK
jgi:glycosyltransferase involved in cell wall biosynthesis